MKKMFKVVSIDEFRTSKLHNNCHHELSHQYSNVLNKQSFLEERKKINSVLYCKHNSCNGMTMNRDTNASKNILELLIHELEHKVRHPDFLRSRKLTDPVNKVLVNQVTLLSPYITRTLLLN